MRLAVCLTLLIHVAVLCCTAPSVATAAPTVWTGLTYSFASTIDQPAQDEITPNVILVRGNASGIYNAVTELSYLTDVSPQFTLWATEFNNDPGTTIAAGNWANLNFTDWRTAYDGQFYLAGNIVGSDAVVYLEQDDIYLDLRFTAWGQGRGNGGTFSYLRSQAVPEPAAAILAGIGVLALVGWCKRRIIP